jgi:WD40-like Beta Propeller Repeat
MRRSIASLLVIGLLAALLASCGQGQAATVQQTAASPTASSHAHTDRIAWQGFLDARQTIAAIFSANADGSNVRQLTHPNFGEEDSAPDWSPDGSKILFARNHLVGQSNDDQALFVISLDGTGLKQSTPWGTCRRAMPIGSRMARASSFKPSAPSPMAPSRSSTRSFPTARTWSK